MKRYINQIGRVSLLVMMMSLILSCKDFLTVPSQGTVSSDNFYQDVSQARMAVYGVYRMLADRALYADKLPSYFHMETDESRIPWSTSNNSKNDWRAVAQYGQRVDTPELKDLYVAYYKLIERANDCIDNIPQMSIWISENGFETDAPSEDLSILRRLYAEAIFIRAIAYNDLIGFFGDVPFKTKSSAAGDNFDLSRDSRDIIYDQIISEMESVVDWLPWFGECTLEERITRGAAKGLLARIALRAAGCSLRWDLSTYSESSLRLEARPDSMTRNPELYEIARRHTWDVISSGRHHLNPDFKDVFVSLLNSELDGEYGERMFEVGVYKSEEGGGTIASYNSPKIAYNEENNLGEGKGYVNALPSLYYAYHPDDTRNAVTNCMYEINNEGKIIPTKLSAMTAGKWRRWWINTPARSRLYTDVNWCMLRYSDVLLMFAEADWWLSNNGNRLGTTCSPEALDAFNQVRRRAFGVDMNTPSEYDVDQLTFNDIVDERSFELAHEGIRKWDLFRWNLMKQKLQETRLALDAIRQNTYAPRHNPDIYGKIPTKCWYKVAAATAVEPTIVFEDPGDTTYASVDWAKSVSTTDVNLLNEDNKRGVARYWQDLHSELCPIPQTLLDNSRNLMQTPSYP